MEIKLFKTKNLNFELKNLDYCKRYIVVVSPRETIGVTLKITITPEIRPPIDLSLDKKTKILTWKYFQNCHPHIFYVIFK